MIKLFRSILLEIDVEAQTQIPSKIHIQNITKVSYAGVPILKGIDLDTPKGVDLEIPKAVILDVARSNGGGISMLLKNLNCLSEPPSGIIFLIVTTSLILRTFPFDIVDGRSMLLKAVNYLSKLKLIRRRCPGKKDEGEKEVLLAMVVKES